MFLLLAQQEEFHANLPVCEIEIIHLSDIRPADAVQSAHNEAVSAWESVSEVMDSEQPIGYHFSAATGDEWNSPREQIYFTGDGQGGTFKISMRYFLEATEGHGNRSVSYTPLDVYKRQSLLRGEQGEARKFAMEILTTIAEGCGAQRLIPIQSVHLVLHTYKSCFDAGVEAAEKIASMGAKFSVPTTIDPYGKMCIRDRQ